MWRVALMGLWIMAIYSRLQAKLAAWWSPILAALKNPACDLPWQVGHGLGGFGFTLLGGCGGGMWGVFHAWNQHQQCASILVGMALGSVLILIVWGIPKEQWWDVKYEGATAADGWRDWRSYFYGVIAAWLLVMAFALVVS